MAVAEVPNVTGAKKKNLLTGKASSSTGVSFGRKYHEAKDRLASQKTELMRALGIEDAGTDAMRVGTVIHGVFEDFAKGLTEATDKDKYLAETDISQMLEEKIKHGTIQTRDMKSEMSVKDYLAQAGVTFREDENGRLSFTSSGDTQIPKKLATALYGSMSGERHETGALQAIAREVFDPKKHEVVNIEGAGIVDGKVITDADLIAKQTEIRYDDAAYKATHVKPDIVYKDKATGMYTVGDWKSSEAGADKSVYQAMVYAA